MINGFKTINAQQPKLAGMGQLLAALLVAIAVSVRSMDVARLMF